MTGSGSATTANFVLGGDGAGGADIPLAIEDWAVLASGVDVILAGALAYILSAVVPILGAEPTQQSTQEGAFRTVKTLSSLFLADPTHSPTHGNGTTYPRPPHSAYGYVLHTAGKKTRHIRAVSGYRKTRQRVAGGRGGGRVRLGLHLRVHLALQLWQHDAVAAVEVAQCVVAGQLAHPVANQGCVATVVDALVPARGHSNDSALLVHSTTQSQPPCLHLHRKRGVHHPRSLR
jgi:hypothetical protein